MLTPDLNSVGRSGPRDHQDKTGPGVKKVAGEGGVEEGYCTGFEQRRKELAQDHQDKTGAGVKKVAGEGGGEEGYWRGRGAQGTCRRGRGGDGGGWPGRRMGCRRCRGCRLGCGGFRPLIGAV